MNSQVHNPAGNPAPASNYAQGYLVSDAKRWLTVSGQVGMHADGSMVDGAEAQMRQAFQNILGVLADAGMGVSNLVKITVFLVDAADVALYRDVRDEMLDGHVCASTLLVIDALASPAWKVEIEAIAAD